MEQNTSARQNNLLDLVKYILSLLVFSIHVNPFGGEYGELRYPFARIAVPLFFIMSSYFLFGKLQRAENPHQKNTILKKFIKRNLILYFTWFLLLFWITGNIRGWFHQSPIRTIPNIVLCFFLSSTFRASWYISATVIGICLVYLLSKKLNNTVLLIIGAVIYVFCCLVSNYYGAIPENSVIITLSELYPAVVYNSFPVSILWIVIGKIFAERSPRSVLSKKIRSILLLLSVCALYAENYLVRYLNCQNGNDCYFMLVPVCILIFSLIIEINIHVAFAKFFRTGSTVNFCLHASLAYPIMGLLRGAGIDTNGLPGAFLLFCITLCLCIMLSLFIVHFESKKNFQWLRLLH